MEKILSATSPFISEIRLENIPDPPPGYLDRAQVGETSEADKEWIKALIAKVSEKLEASD